MKTLRIIVLTLSLILFMNTDSYSQKTRTISSNTGLCVNRYDIIADVYYGYPYLMGILIKKVLADSLGLTTSRNYNHVGARVEYMVWDEVGLGLEYTRALLAAKYQASNGQYYSALIIKQRILAKFNYHFSTTETLDPYLTAGIGYTITQVGSNQPGVKNEGVNIIPVASRIGIGLRYFFTKSFAINVEVGLGGPLMQAGISYKL
jgi:opacity protein-like surface antigen